MAVDRFVLLCMEFTLDYDSFSVLTCREMQLCGRKINSSLFELDFSNASPFLSKAKFCRPFCISSLFGLPTFGRSSGTEPDRTCYQHPS